MIKYDYFIKRDEKIESTEFRPQQIPLELPNLVEIAGPNSSGKSTLLNLLALGFNGLNDTYTIKQSLKEKMSNLIDASHQKITFSISITDKDGNIELTCEKKKLDSKEIIIRDAKNKLITPEEFTRKYKLIYDIPENPTERLKDLLHEIEDVQSQMGTRLGCLREYVDKVIKDIKEARDPEKIKKTRKEMLEEQEKVDIAEREIKSLKEELKKIRTYTAVKFYYEYKEEFQRLTGAISLIKREDQKQKKDLIRVSKEYREKSNELKQEINELKEIYFKVTPFLKAFFDKTEKERLQIWRDIDIEKEIMNHELKKELKLEAANFIVLLRGLSEKYTKSDKDVLIKANIYTQLIELLENYKGINIKLPGIGLTIPKFIEKLKDETSQYEEIVKGSKNITEAIGLLKNLIEKYDNLITDLSVFIKSLKNIKPVDHLIGENEDKFEETKKRMEKAEATMNHYKIECAKLEIKENDIDAFWASIKSKEFKTYEVYTENDLREKIAGLITTIDTKGESSHKRNDYINYLKGDIESLEKREPHSYHKFLPILENLYKTISVMKQKLSIESQEYIKDLQRGQIDKKNITKERQKYFDFVFEFLAQKICFILHINRTFKLKKIDLIEGTIFTAEGNEIKIKDLGTGQSQSAYLTALLSSDDRRKILALFDEVAHMDNRSLGKVQSKLKELYEEGKLLVGVIVQKAEEIRVVPIVKDN